MCLEVFSELAVWLLVLSSQVIGWLVGWCLSGRLYSGVLPIKST